MNTNHCDECGKSWESKYPSAYCDECVESHQQERKRQANQAAQRRALKQSNLPRRQCDLSDVEPHEKLRAFLERDYPRPDNGLLLCGPTRGGKTTQACAGLRWWTRQNVTESRPTGPVFVNMMRLVSSWRPGEDARWSIDELAAAPLLVLDDLGKARASDWVQEQLYRLFNDRYESMLPTVMTANASLSKLKNYDGYRAETYRRLRDMVADGGNVIGLRPGWWT